MIQPVSDRLELGIYEPKIKIVHFLFRDTSISVSQDRSCEDNLEASVRQGLVLSSHDIPAKD